MKKPSSAPRAIKRGTPAPMPTRKPSKIIDKMPSMPSNIATGMKKKAKVMIEPSGGKKSSVIKAPKTKAVPTPKFTAPSVAEFRKSAAYRTDSMTYKQYVDTAYSVFKAKNKIK